MQFQKITISPLPPPPHPPPQPIESNLSVLLNLPKVDADPWLNSFVHNHQGFT